MKNAFHNGFPDDDNARYSIGTQIRYTCMPGFQLYGFPKTMCLSGRWMGPRMGCSPRNCGNPGKLQNGRQDGKLFYFGHSVVYICDKGYELLGSSFRKCLANGTWSGHQPRCQLLQCPVIHAPDNGKVISQNASLGGTVTVSCNSGYAINGDDTRTCQIDRRWSGEKVTCSKIECPEFDQLENGKIIYSGNGLGAVAFFRCNENALLHPSTASDKSICLQDGTWSKSKPQCLSSCALQANGDEALLVNGTQPSPLQYTESGKIVQLSCNKTGYRLHPEIPMLRCQNGTWRNAKQETDSVQPSVLPICQPRK